MDKSELEKLLEEVTSQDGAALHLTAGHRPCMRQNGRLVKLRDDACDAPGLEALGREFLFEDHRQRLDRGEEVEFLYTSSQAVRFRTVVMRQSLGYGLAFHRIPTRIASFESLNLPPALGGFCSLNSGLIVAAGFMGSGRSTTVAALVEQINQTRPAHIVMIEDPIEHIHEPVQACIQQRELGFHTRSFATGVREACLAGADVIVVGNIPDQETLDAVLDATERGVLVITIIHASSVAAGLAELQNLYPVDRRPAMRRRLARTLRVALAQTLLNQPENRGKVPLLEILINSAGVARVIESGAFPEIHEQMLRNRGLGTQTIDAGLKDLIERELISGDEAVFHATEHEPGVGTLA